jgi:hypothetical protein
MLAPNAELVERQRAVAEPFDAGSPRRVETSPRRGDKTSAPRGRAVAEDSDAATSTAKLVVAGAMAGA